MTRPRDRVRLPRPGRVLHHVRLASPVRFRVGFQTTYCVPLVITRKNRLSSFRFRCPSRLHSFCYVHKPRQQIQPCVALPHPLPQIGAAMPRHGRRITRATALSRTTRALVKRQETGPCTLKARRHRHQIRINSEMHHRTLRERHVRLVTINAVLRFSVPHLLASELILQLSRRSRNTVH